MDIKDRLVTIIPELEPRWDEIKNIFKIQKIPAKTILLESGDVSIYQYIVSNGCLRLFIIKEDGSEITVQFFFENQTVASMESAFTGKPGRMYLESIEDTEVIIVKLEDWKELFMRYPEYNKLLIHFLQKRLLYYADLYLSFILNTPEQRYEKLLNDNPEIIKRVPHYYIASYLGITPVSLSRIRSRLSKKLLR